jgi:hypothetical protein
LIESAAAVCVIHSDAVVKIPAVHDSGSYSCSLPAYEMAKNITVGLSLNGVHEVTTELKPDLYCTSFLIT